MGAGISEAVLLPATLKLEAAGPCEKLKLIYKTVWY
jgi:hypothetical protein